MKRNHKDESNPLLDANDIFNSGYRAAAHHPSASGRSEPGPRRPLCAVLRPDFHPVSVFSADNTSVQSLFWGSPKTPKLKSVMKNTLEQKQQHHGRMQPGDRFASMSRLSAQNIGFVWRRLAGGQSDVIGHKRGRNGNWSDAIGQLSE